MQHVRDLLATVPFFASVLKPSDLDSLAMRATAVDYSAGSQLIREGDPGASMFVVVSGDVSVTSGAGRSEKQVASLGPGGIVGEMSLLTGARRSATVTASTPVQAVEIGKEALRPILAASPVLVEKFAAMLQRRQVELDALYGAGRVQMFGFADENFGNLIRAFFSGAS